MRRGLQALRQGLAHAARGLHTSPAAAGEGGCTPFPSWLPSSPSRVATPLTQPLPGVIAEAGYKGPRDPPPTEVTTLPNGVRIVSEASMVRCCQQGCMQLAWACASAWAAAVCMLRRSAAAAAGMGRHDAAEEQQLGLHAGPHCQHGPLRQLWQHL